MKNKKKIKKGTLICEWDPYNGVIISDYAGKISYENIEQGLTYEVEIDEQTGFQEKVAGDGSLINGGYFILEPKVLDLIDGDPTIWEQEPLKKLAKDNQLNAFKHDGFWQPMDTLREKNQLQEMWDKNKAPWKIW